MPYRPPRCPNPSCRHHRRPAGGFFLRHGTFRASCRELPEPRFRCRGCGRTFSRQTFRHDYRDRRPECNEPLFRLLVSGVGLRQAGRQLHLAVSSVQQKFRKIGRTCRWLHRNLCRRLPEGRTFLLDEEETFAGASIDTVTMPVVMELESWFVVAITAGPIRRRAKKGTRRRAWQDTIERRQGRRRDRSKACVRLALGRMARCVPGGALTLRTDDKASYRTLARALFGERVRHQTTPGTRERTPSNPLFPINTTLAMTRDNNGRLRRKSWLVSKKVRYLRLQMQIFTVYRDYVRRRFNRDGDDNVTAAVVLGVLPRAMRPREALRWRQDWGPLSSHPLSYLGTTTVTESLRDSA